MNDKGFSVKIFIALWLIGIFGTIILALLF